MRADLLKSEADGAALSLKFKHIILAVLDVQRDEPLGMINHVRAAMLAGATAAEITESVLLGIIVNGMPAWGKIGRKAVEFAVNFEQEQKKKSGP
jgi:alkylhydroperoxidase/carboxymuconolactone decarboxylase family protein YurZ